MTTTLAPIGETADQTRRRPSTRIAVRLTMVKLTLLVREPMTAISLLAFPIVTVLVLAGVFGNTPDPEFGGVAPDDHYLVGYIGVVLAALGLITIPVHIASQRELGVQRRYRASGVGPTAIISSELAVGAILGVISAALVLAVSVPIYGLDAPEHPLAVAGWFATGLACFIAIGLALGSMVGTGRAANALGNLLFVPMFLVGGGGPPRAVMPAVMRNISEALPLSHIIGGLRLAWLGQTEDPHSLWWPALVAVVAVVFAAWNTHRTAER